jgi:uncharacterized protein (TIGR03067 family)
MHRAAIVVLGIALLAVGARAGDANQADLKRLQGKWKVVSRQLDGQSLKPGEGWTISGNKIPYGGGCYAVLTLHADQTPKAFDLDQYDAGRRPIKGGTGFKGIYAFEGQDHLKWCVTGTAGRPRPKALESKQGDGNLVYVFERVKE